MRRIFCDGPLVENEAAQIGADDLHHAKNVLRMKDGETIFLVDPAGNRCVGTVETQPEFLIRCGAVERTKSVDPAGDVTLYMGLAKGEKFDFVVQKAVELGARYVVPVTFSRCVARLRDEKDAEKKCARWNKIARSAAMQSGAPALPEVLPPKNVCEVCKEIRGKKTILAYELERRRSIGDALNDAEAGAPLGLIVGPEGGIDESEARALIEAGAVSVSLGTRILRCETAPLALLSVVQFVRGGMDAPDKEEA